MKYEYVGYCNLGPRFQKLLKEMETELHLHPSWRHASETTLALARDGIEKYIMEKLYTIVLSKTVESQEWKIMDKKLLRRMHLLSVRAVVKLTSYITF